MEELLTFEALATMAGASIATSGIVQLIKGYVPIKTDLLSYVVAAAIMGLATFALSTSMDWRPYALALVNAVFVSFAANRVAQIAGEGK